MLNKRNTSWLPLAAILALFAVTFLAAPVFAQDEAPAEPAPEAIPLEETPPVEVLPAELPEGVALAVENESGEAVSLASEEAAQILAAADPWFKVGAVEYNFTSADCDPVAGGNQPCANPIQAAINWVRDNATIPTDGLIHIENGTYDFMSINIDGSNVNVNKLKGLQGSLDAASNQPNVLLNDRILVTNKTTPFTLSGLSVIGSFPNVGLVEFTNNSGVMTLQDMVITNSGGTASTGLRMEQTGAITLNRVNVSNNMVDAAVLDNDAGTAGITITNSSFENNGITGSGTGLTINSKGAVLLNNVSFFDNQQTGLLALTTKSLTIKNSAFARNGDFTNHALTVQPGSAGLVWIENSAFRNNYQDAIHIDLAGDVTLKNLDLFYNYRRGAYINTCNPIGTPGTACTTLGNGNVTVTGSRFDGNHSGGTFTIDDEASLFVWAKGAITLADVKVTNSGFYSDPATHALTYGAFLYNADAPSAKNISITKSNFNTNTATGLLIRTKGSVSMNNIISATNYVWAVADPTIHGVDIDASFGSGTVTLLDTLGSNAFISNNGDGIRIVAKGSVSLTNLDASGNGNNAESIPYNDGMGVYINNLAGTGSVTVKKLTAEYNRNSGVEIFSNGSVTVDTADLQYNGESFSGTALLIGDPATPTGAVTLKRISLYSNSINGMTIHTKSNVLMDFIRARYQQSGSTNPYGAYVNATYGTGTVTLQNTLGLSLAENNQFNQNDLFGLQILAKGKISLSDVNFYNNAGGDGLNIDNSTGTGDVVLSKVYAEYNREDGIQILSSGNVSLSTGFSNNNGNGGIAGYGLRIDNTPALIAKTVTITNFGGNYNKDLGFWVLSDGAINLKTVYSYGNGNASGTPDAAGALFNNTSGTTAGVTMTRAVNNNNFADHYASGNMPGLRILSNGAVSLSYVDAYSNNLAGVIIKNDYPGKTGGVTLSNVHIWSNDEQNLIINTNGAVKLTGGQFSSTNSAQPGVEIHSMPASGAPVITISHLNISDSTGTGLYVEAKGSITLNAVISDHNDGIGVELYNETGSGGVSMLGTLGANEVYYNGLEGMIIHTKGAVILTRLDVYQNGTAGSTSGPAIHGAILDNSYGIADVTLTNTTFEDNVYGSGVQISTLGKVTWTGGNVENNGNSLSAGAPGVWINNQPVVYNPLAPAKTVTITNVSIHEINGIGLDVIATGAITLSGVKIYDQDEIHSDYGARLNNVDYSGGVTITGTGNQFNGQSNYYGLYVNTSGKVSLSNLEANNNDQSGVGIDNKGGKLDVVITNATIIGNSSRHGLIIWSLGNITLTNVAATYNGSSTTYFNAYLDNNDDPATIKNITLNKVDFSSGNGNGLHVETRGNILVNKISTSWHYTSGAVGVYLDNSSGVGSVTFLSTFGRNEIYSNEGNNLTIHTNGAVTINGLTSSGSYHDGVYIDNSSAPAGSYPGVTINNSILNENAGYGLEAFSKGAITLTSVTAQYNVYSNAYLDNHYDDTHTKAITVTKGTFIGGAGSGGAGVEIIASAAVIMNTVTASNSHRNGVMIDASSYSNGTVTISGTNVFNENSYSGLVINAHGTVTISNVTANDNSDRGIDITTTSGITITNGMIKRNANDGIYATANGKINLTGITVMLNGQFTSRIGIYLSSPGNDITITNGIVTANGSNGIAAYTGAGYTLTLKNTLWAGNGYPNNPSTPDLVYNGLLVIQ